MRLLLICVLLLTMALPASALMSLRPYPDGELELMGPQEFVDLVNMPGRVYGYTYFISTGPDIEVFYFQGNNEGFARFLAQYRRLGWKDLPLGVHVGPAPPITGPKFPGVDYSDGPYNWMLTRTRHPEHQTVALHVWLHGGLDQLELNVSEALEPVFSESRNTEWRDTRADDTRPFGIYLLRNPDVTGASVEGKDPASLELQDAPLLGANDILGWDWEAQTINISEKGLERLPKPGVYGVPFVVVADGKPQYVGAFWTGVSSASFQEPVIIVPSFTDELPRGVVQLQRAYPGLFEGDVRPDPRLDDAVRRELKRLDKLTKIPPGP